MYLFCYALLCVHSSFAIILKRKIKLVALLLLSYRCIVTINVLWLFLTVQWVGLLSVIVVFPDHTHLLFAIVTNETGLFVLPKSSGMDQEKQSKIITHPLHVINHIRSSY